MKYDLHVHTKYSVKCGHMAPAELIKVAKQRGMNGIAVCDHNTIKGALEAKRLNRDRNFEVIVGEEVKTDCGDLLLYDVKKEVPPGSLMETIKEGRRQGCLIVIPHPFRYRWLLPRKGFTYPLENLRGKIHAVEALNGRTICVWNLMARRKAKQLGIAMTGGSDGHYPAEVGRCWSEFNGSLAEALKKKEIRQKGTTFFGLIAGIRHLIAREASGRRH